jgi:hypothetical protein
MRTSRRILRLSTLSLTVAALGGGAIASTASAAPTSSPPIKYEQLVSTVKLQNVNLNQLLNSEVMSLVAPVTGPAS